jgi:hypothetical protein
MNAKARGFKKGDLVFTGAFPGVLISDVHTLTPVCEVWGIEHESGSVYASDLKRLDPAQFMEALKILGHAAPVEAYSKVAAQALAAAGIQVKARN